MYVILEDIVMYCTCPDEDVFKSTSLLLRGLCHSHSHIDFFVVSVDGVSSTLFLQDGICPLRGNASSL